MCDREQASVPSFFLQLSHRTTQACQDARNKDGTSNQDLLEISRVSAPDTSVLHGIRPSTEQSPYPGTSWASTKHHHSYADGSGTIPYKHATSGLAQGGWQGRTQKHAWSSPSYQDGTARGHAVRKPRVGQRSMRLSIPTLTSMNVPCVSPWSYKRRDSGTQHKTTLIRRRAPHFTPRLYSPLYKHLGAR